MGHSADTPPGAAAVENGAGQARPYQTVSVLTWEVGQGVRVEARLETLAARLMDAPAELPASRLVITNLSNGKTILEHETDDRPTSFYTLPLNGDVGEALIVMWVGGSAGRVQIFAVDAAQARTILNESFRVDVAFIDLSGEGAVDVLITTAEGGAEPPYTTRYVWDGKQYIAKGVVPREKFIEGMKKLFAQ